MTINMGSTLVNLVCVNIVQKMKHLNIYHNYYITLEKILLKAAIRFSLSFFTIYFM